MIEQKSERELSIDTEEGLQEFLQFIEDVYRDFVIALQQKAGTRVLTSGELLSVETSYRAAQERILHYQKIIAFGGELQQEHIDELQQYYDTIVGVYDSLTQQPPASPDEVLNESVILDTPTHGVDATRDRAGNLAAHAEELLFECSELEEVGEPTKEIAQAKRLYRQLKVVHAELQQKIRDLAAVDSALSVADRVRQAERHATELDEYERLLRELRGSLLKYFEPPQPEIEKSVRAPKKDFSKKNDQIKHFYEQPSFFAPMVESLLKEADYAAAVTSKYGSVQAFEAALKREVYRMERPSKLDSLLGVKHKSALAFLGSMTLSDIERFDTREPRELVRGDLLKEDVPYETYLAWLQAMSYMESLVESHDEMTFLELFIRAELALLVLDVQEKNNNSQGVYN